MIPDLRYLIPLGIAAIFGFSLTIAASWAGTTGLGASYDFAGGVSIRDGSVGQGRVFIGGGVMGGK